MTPEQRAKNVQHRAGWTIPPWVYDIIVDAIRETERAAIEAEHARITEMAEAIEQGRYTTTRTVAQVLRAEQAK